MVAVLTAPGALRGDFGIVRKFFETYPGSQPFVIYTLPVILICGSAWIWRIFTKGKRGEGTG